MTMGKIMKTHETTPHKYETNDGNMLNLNLPLNSITGKCRTQKTHVCICKMYFTLVSNIWDKHMLTPIAKAQGQNPSSQVVVSAA